MTLVIMAAGMGSRFGGLKQIEPIGPSGEFILDYSIYDAIRAGFNKVVFIIKEENYDLFRTTIGKRIETKIQVEYVFQNNDNVPKKYHIPAERVKPLGTGHAILCTAPKVKENFVVINADDFYGRKAYVAAYEFLSKVAPKESNYCMISYNIKNTIISPSEVARGVCQSNETQYLTKITESKVRIEQNTYIAKPLDESIPEFKIKPDTLVSMNIWGFTPTIFTYLANHFTKFLVKEQANLLSKEFLLPNVVHEAIIESQAQVKVLATKAKWLGITYKEDKAILVKEINKLINKGEYPANLWSI